MEQRFEEIEKEAARINGAIQVLERSCVRVEIGVYVSIFIGIIKLFQGAMDMPQGNPSPITSGNHIKIGMGELTDPQRSYLTTKEVAEKEGVTPRTVVEWIDRRKIIPAPERNGDRAWAIAANYRILPLTADPAEPAPLQ